MNTALHHSAAAQRFSRNKRQKYVDAETSVSLIHLRNPAKLSLGQTVDQSQVLAQLVQPLLCSDVNRVGGHDKVAEVSIKSEATILLQAPSRFSSDREQQTRIKFLQCWQHNAHTLTVFMAL